MSFITQLIHVPTVRLARNSIQQSSSYPKLAEEGLKELQYKYFFFTRPNDLWIRDDVLRNTNGFRCYFSLCSSSEYGYYFHLRGHQLLQSHMN